MTQHAIHLDKPLPCAPETEKQVLGCVLMDESVFGEVAVLDPLDFYSQRHRDAYTVMHGLIARNEPVTPISVFEGIRTLRGDDIKITEIMEWYSGLPVGLKVGPLISILKDKTLKRKIISECSRIANASANEEELGVDLIGEAVTTFQSAYTTTNSQKPTLTFAEGVQGNYERWDKMLRHEIVTIETGLSNVDSGLTGGGLEKGMWHVIGARPGMGKTTIGLDMIAHNARNGKVSVFFSLELSKDVLLDRFLAPLAGVPRWRITSNWINQSVKDRLVVTAERIKGWPFFLNTKARTVADMRLALKEVARQTGGQIDLIIVDFLTKMHIGNLSKYEGVSKNANGLAEFASEFNAASVALAQLSRAAAKRTASDPEEQGRVETTDFRDSGEIEELARTILTLWGNDTDPKLRDVNLSCIKQGEGALFETKLIFNAELMTFGVRQPVDVS